MQINKRGNAVLLIVLLFAALALGGLLWTTMESPTGDIRLRLWGGHRPVVVARPRVVVTQPVIIAPPHRQAYACVCTTPKDEGTCAVASCLSGDVAQAYCLRVLPPRSECGTCTAEGSMQHATSSVHVIATLTCAV